MLVNDIKIFTDFSARVLAGALWIILKGSRESLDIRLINWLTILQLARQNGWRPTGTELNKEHLREMLTARQPEAMEAISGPPSIREAEIEQKIAKAEAEHMGSYMPNYDYVGAEDAMNIARALEYALKNNSVGRLPKRETLPCEKQIIEWDLDASEILNDPGGREWITAVINVCKGGRFYIA